MAFDQRMFATIGAQSSDTPTVYSYKSTDNLDTVITIGYFSGKQDQLEEGDWIFCFLSDGNKLLEVLGDSQSAADAGVRAPNKETVINKESEFPDPSGGVITLVADTKYQVGDDVSIGTDRLDISAGGIQITGHSTFNPSLTYTGTGAMITGVDFGNLCIDHIALSAANGKVFELSDPGGSNAVCLIDAVNVTSADELGTFSELTSLVITGSSGVYTDGMTLSGSGWLVCRIQNTGFISLSNTFTAIDLGTFVAPIITLSSLLFSAPSGAIAISGAADSANLSVGSLGLIRDAKFLNAITPLSGITRDDIRWKLDGNDEIADTKPDAMVSLIGNSTETVISTAGVPVKLAGTWVVERESQFTADTTGKITYDGERPITAPVDIVVILRSASGTNKDVTVFLALNGIVIANSAKTNEVGSGNPKSITVLWQRILQQDDDLEVFVQNDTDTVNLVGESAIQRVL